VVLCICVFFNGWLCVCVVVCNCVFLMCVYLYVWVCTSFLFVIGVYFCMCGFSNLWVCVLWFCECVCF